jgi:cytochrome c oxidase subunit 2
LYLLSAIIVAGIVFGLFIYYLVRYRRKPGVPDPEDAPKLGVMADRGNPALAAILTALLVALFFGLTLNTFAVNAYLQNPPNDPSALRVNVVGFQWGWRFVYANGKDVISQLRVPIGTTVILNITSQDVFHSFGIPDFKIKRDAIPGRVNQAWFVADVIGIYTIRCYELCGTGHALMTADLLVLSQQGFTTWYNG